DALELIEANVRALVRTRATEAAADFAERALDKTWSKVLVEEYGRIGNTRPGERLAHAERWLPSRANDASLLTALGRLASFANEPDKARGYFEAALRSEPTATVYAELERLSAARGDAARAAEYQSRALELAGVALPAPIAPPSADAKPQHGA